MPKRPGNGHVPQQRGPWVNIATVCRELVQDLMDGPTLRGLITGVTLGVPEEARNITEFVVAYEPLIVLTLSGGQPGQEALITVDTEGADGRLRPGDNGVTLRFDPLGVLRQPISLNVDFWGEQQYWFNVRMDGRLLTRVPLHVRYEFLPPGEMGRQRSW